jgi:hypothetical protein
MTRVSISSVITRGLGIYRVRRGPTGHARCSRLGILADGAAAEAIGVSVAVGLAYLVGLTAATMLVMNWTHLHARLIRALQAEAEATGTSP